eukprot:TRINITY_DN10619_c0_g2_i7.p1 TRINITY_DN10619_c0_g2~~TRINITY_DN10619_c0_g2_i7.p1  ORF type:complete len:139 (+),score=10.29 TRINITY_DN10619_c0_g2_i7:287-703(+)
MALNSLQEEITVTASQEAAFQGWLQYIWREGGGMGKPRIINDGDADGVGMQRRVPGAIVEEITALERFRCIEYTIAKGPFPCSTHTAKVTFEPLQNDATKVTWQCTITPYWGFGWFVSWLVPFVFARMLSHMKDQLEA